MPEGFEIYILTKCLQKLDYDCKCYGKHIFIIDSKQDWNFGLQGKLNIDQNEILHKIETNWMSGTSKSINSFEDMITTNRLGLDLLRATKNEITQVIDNWKTSRKMLGVLVLDQSQIAGIGVAWGSEILNLANLRPDIQARHQDLSKLVDTIIKIRTITIELYNKIMQEYENQDNLEYFVNEWYENLYNRRQMKVYKIGSMLTVVGRRWWILHPMPI